MDTGKYINFNKGIMPAGGDSGILSKIKSAGGNFSYTAIIAIVAGILFLILAVLYYFYYVAPQANAKYQPNNSPNSPANDAELLFFFADWCPHCKKAVPVFEEVEKAYNDNKNDDKRINGYHVTFKVIDCEADPTTADKYKVEGYPTIKLDKGGDVIEFDAKPDKEKLLEFLHQVL
jgi:thiol-disulfide isomerase/thioredoxin